MAISRPLLLALLGAALLGATFLAVQNTRNSSTEEASQPVQELVEKPADAPSQDPEATLASALENVDSARFRARISARGMGESASLVASGAFAEAAKNEVGRFEINFKVRAGGRVIDVGLVSLEDRAYFTRDGKAYRVPPRLWRQVVAHQRKQDTSVAQLSGLNPGNWLRDVKQSAGARVDGVATTRVTASLDLPTIVREVVSLSDDGSNAVPPELQRFLNTSVKRSGLEVVVGRSDGVLRSASADVVVDVRERRPLRLSGDLRLRDVNRAQGIRAPKNVVAGVPAGASGSFAYGLVRAMSGGRPPEAASLTAVATRNPRRAPRAVKPNKKVVIFFRNPRGLDDRAVARAVEEVDRSTDAVVLTDHVDAVERYGKLVEDLGVSQAPSIVIIDRRGEARLLEGYVDTASLHQALADAR
jgi:hypothetical protein